jgi:DNA-3-methyladenine glycosylase II
MSAGPAGGQSRPGPAAHDRPDIASGPKLTYRQAATLLAAEDPVIARLVRDVGLPTFPAPGGESHFATLVRSIVYQQLATRAAQVIHGRLIAALADDVSAERVLATPGPVLKSAGLSQRKVESLQDLATKTLDGTVILNPRRLARVGDEEIITRLSAVRGIGRWSAQMFLMFQLRRPDVWPVGDLGIRHGYALAWQVDVPAPKALELLGEPYRPYRTVVAWYCWRAAEVYGGRSAAPVEGV